MKQKLKNYFNNEYIAICVESYEQELQEIQDIRNDVESFYYHSHGGIWILKFRNDIPEDEFDTKEEMMNFIKSGI